MFFRILETPLLDVLVLLLVVRIFFPSLFGVKRKSPSRERSGLFIRTKSKTKSSDPKNEEGEYIEYEEIK